MKITADVLTEINKIIFAKGAPLGSEEYFKIRDLCTKHLKSEPGLVVGLDHVDQEYLLEGLTAYEIRNGPGLSSGRLKLLRKKLKESRERREEREEFLARSRRS